METITISAWENDRYVSLPELLFLLGPTALDLRWELSVEDAAPGPESEALVALARRTMDGERANVVEVLTAFLPNGQLVDGQLVGYEDSESPSPVARFTAVDSTWWDIEGLRAQLLDAVTSRYQAVDRDGT